MRHVAGGHLVKQEMERAKGRAARSQDTAARRTKRNAHPPHRAMPRGRLKHRRNAGAWRWGPGRWMNHSVGMVGQRPDDSLVSNANMLGVLSAALVGVGWPLSGSAWLA